MTRECDEPEGVVWITRNPDDYTEGLAGVEYELHPPLMGRSRGSGSATHVKPVFDSLRKMGYRFVFASGNKPETFQAPDGKSYILCPLHPDDKKVLGL